MPIAESFVDDLRAVEIDHPKLGATDAYELVMTRLEQMSEGRDVFEPFAGPLEDRNGNVVYEDGYVPTIDDLVGLEFAVPGVVGPWDNEPE